MKTKTFENGNAKSVTCHRFQSRTQGPLAFWSAGGRQERHWRIENFFDWLPRIGLHCFTCGNKIPVPQSLSWRPPADQRTLGTVPVQIGTSIEDGGWSCDFNTCAVPCPSRFHRFRAFYCRQNASLDENICFVFALMKTDTFENALVWMWPELNGL